MDWILKLASLITAFTVIGGFFILIFKTLHYIIEGIKCLLRSEILRIYYQYKDVEQLRQYQKEVVIHLYKAYISLKGNSFVKQIYEEMCTWDVCS